MNAEMQTPAAEDPYAGYCLEGEHPGHARQSPRGVAVVLHGHDPWGTPDPGSGIRPAVNAIRQRLTPHGFHVWAPLYDTHQPFVVVAREIANLIGAAPWGTRNVHFFGYSMGGLVARQVAVLGIEPRSLVTYCTPNLGTAAWVPTPTAGAMSMAPWSADLRALNENPGDRQLRGRYHTIGFSYARNADGSDRHYNDGVVEVDSALMVGQSPSPARRVHWNSHLRGALGPGEPHTSAQAYPGIAPAVDYFVRLVGETSVQA